MWGGLKDQSLAANQGETGFIPPSGRIYGNMFSLPLGGNPLAASSIGYSGSNYFGVNIAGLGITVELAEAIDVTAIRLEYRLSINDRQVYMQELDPPENLYPGDQLEWFFDHPVEITAGTTIFAEIVKVSRTQQTVVNRATVDVTVGVLQVRVGDDGTGRYQTIVHNRLFEDKDIELISPYLKYQAMDFSVDDTGVNILLKDTSLAADAQLLIPHNINTLQAVATGTTIQIKQKGGAKVIVESLPVNATSINGTFVNAVLNSAVLELNNLFTNALSFASQGNPVSAFALAGNNLTLTLTDATSYTVDVTTLGVDTDNFVSSAELSGTTITLTMDDATSVLIPVASLAIDNDTTITSGSVTGNTMSLTTNSGSIITVDVTSLATGSSLNVSSGLVVGTNLVLTMSDSSTVTIDASNMINGSNLSSINDEWYFSYGTDANAAVSIQTNTSAIHTKGPFYFGQALTQGSEFKFNMPHANSIAMKLGIFDGPQVASNRDVMLDENNWSTAFVYINGPQKWLNGPNIDVGTYHANGYVAVYNMPMVIRFGSDGHLTLLNLTGASDGGELIIAKTILPLSVSSFNLQIGLYTNNPFLNGIVTTSDWLVVHDFDNSDGNLLDGIEDHTVLKTQFSIVPGEKFMLHLDTVGKGAYFGTGYTGAASGNSQAEKNLENTFQYQTNESLLAKVNGASDYNLDATSPYYFVTGGGTVPSWRHTGSNNVQGMFSVRYLLDNSIEIWSEDKNDLVMTSKVLLDGNPIQLYFGSQEGTMTYGDIPEVSKQSIGSGTQPIVDFAPDITNQSFSVQEGDAINGTIALDNNSDVVSMFGETDAPSWLILNQITGVFTGTAPAFTGSSDAYVVNCKAGNSIGGITNFTVTFNITSYASTNSKSLRFLTGSNSVIQGNASQVTALQRAANGTGAGDAWSISMWVKPSVVSNTQTLFAYGGDDPVGGEGGIHIFQFSGPNIAFQYGSNSANIRWYGVGTFPTNQWNHILITYDGGTTGSTSADLSSYVSRFSFNVNGAQAFTQIQNSASGYSGSIGPDIFRVGKYLTTVGNTNHLSDGIVNQIAIWDTDQVANLATIYNAGSTQDLANLAAPPVHYYEIETSTTSIPDLIGSADLAGFNFSASDLVTDTP